MSEPYDMYFVFGKKTELDKALKFIKTNSNCICPKDGIHSFVFETREKSEDSRENRPAIFLAKNSFGLFSGFCAQKM